MRDTAGCALVTCMPLCNGPACACRLAVLQQQLADSQGLVAKAEGWRKRWEICQMEVEDLQAANIRATMRRQELVSSYWPVMERLNSAEDVVAALTQQVGWRRVTLLRMSWVSTFQPFE